VPPPAGLYLTREQMEVILQHAQHELPDEACGLLGGLDGRVQKVYPLPNAQRSSVYYEAEPQALLAAILEMESHGWEPVPLGIYHSHPYSEAYPSATDVKLAYYPDAVYLIVSPTRYDQPTVRAFRIVAGQVTEEQVIIE